jgi:hypothetical protein
LVDASCLTTLLTATALPVVGVDRPVLVAYEAASARQVPIQIGLAGERVERDAMHAMTVAIVALLFCDEPLELVHAPAFSS